MSFQSIGDLATHLRLQTYQSALKRDVGRLGQELSSGRAADTAARAQGALSPLAALERSLALTRSYRDSIADLALTAATQQQALSRLTDLASRTGPALAAAGATATEPGLTTQAQAARAALETAVGALNLQAAGRGVFAGTAGGRATLGADALMADLGAALSGAGDAAAVLAGVDAYFANGGAYDTAFYTGGDARGPTTIDDAETATLDATARDPAIRATIRNLALAALADGTVLDGDIDGRAALLSASGRGPV
jgi:flagellar hook-associated protein 3 FlgL